MTTSQHDDGATATAETANTFNPSGKTFFGHPRMLANLFTVEMWERFSYYGMQAIMLYYLYFTVAEGGLGLNETAAAGVMGAYGGMVYLLAILGGFLGDRVFGPERTLFYSAITIMLGHIALALIPGVPGVVVGLILVAVGSGCLKTNASTLVGSLYSQKDPRRDGGFTIFYMGVNTGALVGPLLTGWMQLQYGFHIGFGVAAIGMAAGLIQYSLTRKNLPASAHQLSEPLSSSGKMKSLIIGALIIVVVAVLVLVKAINPNNLATWVMALVAAFGVAIFIMLFTSKKTSEAEHSRIIAFVPMLLGNIVFFALFQQQFSVLAIYSESRVDWNIGGIQFPFSWFNSINPVFILLFGAVFTAMWTKMGTRQPTTPKKFALGLILIGVAFLVFLLQAGNTSVNILWLVLILFICTMGELSLSPVGTSLASKLAPEAHRVMMMALYFCSVSMGTVIAGWLANFYSLETEVPYFTAMGLISIGAGIVLWLMNAWIVKRMAGVH